MLGDSRRRRCRRASRSACPRDTTARLKRKPLAEVVYDDTWGQGPDWV